MDEKTREEFLQILGKNELPSGLEESWSKMTALWSNSGNSGSQVPFVVKLILAFLHKEKPAASKKDIVKMSIGDPIIARIGGQYKTGVVSDEQSGGYIKVLIDGEKKSKSVLITDVRLDDTARADVGDVSDEDNHG